MNEGIFPSKKSRTKEAMEEERRVAFVAYTRAMKKLYLSMAEGRNFDGSPRYPSRFVLEPEEGLIDYVEQPRESLIKETFEYIGITDRVMKGMDEETRLPVGTRVKHMIFGEGEIIDIDADRHAYVIKFDSQNTERVISFKVKLETLE
jgi:DNA helicase-2/ATP-dependent DNA helicase PcrA